MNIRFLQPLACAILAAALCLQPLAAGDIKVDGKLVSTAPTGTPPLQVDSTTLVPNLNAEFLNGLPASAFQTSTANVVRVGKSGAPFTSIQAAIDSITDADFDNWYVVEVGPGVYNESVTLKNFVTVVGQGKIETRIWVEAAGSVTAVQGAQVSVLSDIGVIALSTDGGDATALNAPIFRLRRASLFAETSSPGQAIGLRVAGDFSVNIVDSELNAGSGAVNTGLYMETPAQVEMVGGEISASSGAGATNYGVRQEAVSGFGSLSLTEVGVRAVAGSVGYGIRSEAGGFFLNRCGVSGSGSTNSVGAYNASGNPNVSDSSIVAFEGSTVGFQNASGIVTIRESSVTGGLDVAAGSVARIAYSRLSGALSGTGDYACIGNYDSFMSAVNCPTP